MQSSQVDLSRIDSSLSENYKQSQSSTRTKRIHNAFQNLKKNSTSLFNQSLFTDDQFSLQQVKSPNQFPNPADRKISISRLKDILQPGTPLFGQQVHQKFKFQNNIPHYPKFICQMHALPFWHYQALIQPKYVNQKGFYHVVLFKEGRLAKQTIDDSFYYDQTFKTIYNEFPNFKTYVWMHIILKAWAKCKKGFSQILNAAPFQFIKTFSYPDWKIINPSVQDIQKLISTLNPIEKKNIFAVAQTKNDPNVGLFGLIPNSASYLISGHQMQFQAIFIKIKSLTGTKWNKLKSIQDIPQPSQQIQVQKNQFYIPLKQFTNLFHLIYITSNKFQVKQDIYYNRYNLNLDARQSKAKMVCFEIMNPNPTDSQKQSKQPNYMANINIYFSPVSPYDLNKQRHQNQNQFVIPYCKLMFGKQSQTTNLQASFVQSMKEKMLSNQDGNLLYSKAIVQYQWIQGTYFRGYDNSCTFIMKLKPGRYYLRFKMETLRVQYRANINVVSSTHVRISDPKMDKRQQQQFLKQILSSKARQEKRNIGYLNPIKKGSWYICNDDFDSIGYGYIVVQTRRGSDYKIQLKVDPKHLKTIGYRLKSKKDQNKYTLNLQQGQSHTLILKLQEGYTEKQRVWPPTGVQVIRLWKNS